MAAPALLCATLEIALNRVLRAEPASLARCASLDGRTLAIETSDLGWRVILQPQGRTMRVFSDDTAHCNVTARASSVRLVAMALRSMEDNAGGNKTLPEGLEVHGDAELLRQFASLFALAGFDPEEGLAPLLGDAAAHRVAEGVRGLFGWARSSSWDLAYSGAEYLREETGDLARGGDVEEWLQDVETLRERIDRLEARMQRQEHAS